MSLKDLTWEHHKEAERQEFVKVLMSGKINPDLYATYLWNQHMKYDVLEALATANGLLTDLPGIQRRANIFEDYNELWVGKEGTPPTLPCTTDYINHVKDIMQNPQALMAHIYVLHMGDLSGGQMIAKRVPGSGKYYQFDADTDTLKNKIREKINDNMAEEAKWVFSNAVSLFRDMMKVDMEKYID
jgi:heme oxygenase